MQHDYEAGRLLASPEQLLLAQSGSLQTNSAFGSIELESVA
jgi:hypothetical protein